jgi:hypothetical protein
VFFFPDNHPSVLSFASEWDKREGGLLDDKSGKKVGKDSGAWPKEGHATSTNAMVDCSAEEFGRAARQETIALFGLTQRID